LARCCQGTRKCIPYLLRAVANLHGPWPFRSHLGWLRTQPGPGDCCKWRTMSQDPLAQVDSSIPQQAQAGAAIDAILENNINALIARRMREGDARKAHHRLADAIIHFAGSMTCVCFHLVLFSGWIVIGRGWTRLPGFDPSLSFLATCASME